MTELTFDAAKDIVAKKAGYANWATAIIEADEDQLYNLLYEAAEMGFNQPRPAVTEDKIREMLEKLDDYGRDVDVEYGLPQSDNHLSAMVALCMEILNKK